MQWEFGSTIIFHLCKLWKAKFFILCDVILTVSLQEKSELDHSPLVVKGFNAQCTRLGNERKSNDTLRSAHDSWRNFKCETSGLRVYAEVPTRSRDIRRKQIAPSLPLACFARVYSIAFIRVCRSKLQKYYNFLKGQILACAPSIGEERRPDLLERWKPSLPRGWDFPFSLTVHKISFSNLAESRRSAWFAFSVLETRRCNMSNCSFQWKLAQTTVCLMWADANFSVDRLVNRIVHQSTAHPSPPRKKKPTTNKQTHEEAMIMMVR